MAEIGVCANCGGELDGRALRLALEAGPGPRGDRSYTSVVRTRLDRFDLCTACLHGPGAVILVKMLEDAWNRALPENRRCTVTCLQPSRKTLILVTRREKYEETTCPVCYGHADVQAAPGARPVRLGWWNKLRGRAVPRQGWAA